MEATITATIRPSRKEDLPALEWMGLYAPHRQIIHDAFEAQCRGDALLLLAIARDFPIAQVWIDFAAKRRQRIAILWAIRTFYPLQRVGIGRNMVQAAERILRWRGVGRAELEVDDGNQPALAFYRRMGWHIIGCASDPALQPASGRSDRWIMAKDIPRL